MREKGYLLELPLDEMFPEEADESTRLDGGPYYRERFIPIEEIPAAPPYTEDMFDYDPAPLDLIPFHVVMGSPSEAGLLQPSFSSPLSGRAVVKITLHRGGKEIRPRTR